MNVNNLFHQILFIVVLTAFAIPLPLHDRGA
jgi:hypothetical protein